MCKSKRGGLEIEIVSRPIPPQYAIDNRRDISKGTIKNIEYLDESPSSLRRNVLKIFLQRLNFLI